MLRSTSSTRVQACWHAGDVSDDNTFVRHAEWLWSARHVDDPEVFRKLVHLVSSRVEEVDGRAVRVTPFARADALADAIGFAGDLWVKDETVNVAGSHKARHLIGLALHLLARDPGDTRPLAISSCGNAALAAAVVAKAIKRDLRVFIPPDANPVVVGRLHEMGAQITVCARRLGEQGDPCFLRFEELLRTSEAVAFCCQGTISPETFDGGRTIAWEILEQFVAATGAEPAVIDRVFVQVGGGALATSVHLGMATMAEQGMLALPPALYAVQSAGAAPLARAYEHVRALATERGIDAALRDASAHPDQFMWPWESEPRSIATGILDDFTYDWFPIVAAMFRNGGEPVVVDEATLIEANKLAREHTGINVDHTGTAGLAGLMQTLRANRGSWQGENIVVLFTGEYRG